MATIDDFEDGDISEWSGDTGSFSTTTSVAFDGSVSVTTSSAPVQIQRTDKTVSTSTAPLGAWVQVTNKNSRSASFHFAVNSGSYYKLQIFTDSNGNISEFSLSRIGSNSTTTLASDTSPSGGSTGEWLRIELTKWKSDGTLSASLFDTSDTELAAVSASDTTYSSGGVEVTGYSSVGDSAGTVFWDKIFYNPIEPPSNVQITDASTEDELTIDWDPVSNASGYYVYRAEQSGSTKADYTQVADVTGPPYTDTNLEDGERYYYRVSAHN